MKKHHPGSGKKLPVAAFAYAEIKRRVLDNEFAPGAYFLEQEIAEILAVSRTPVREALQKLQQEGLVEVVPRRGVRIVPISGSDMQEIYVILTGLEAAAAELVARRGLSSNERDSLTGAVTRMDQALDNDDLLAWARADEDFHRYLVALTNNNRLITMVQMLWDQSHRARMTTLKLRPRPVKSNDDHRALIEAIGQGDAELAGKIHSSHRRQSGAMLVALLEDLGLKQL